MRQHGVDVPRSAEAQRLSGADDEQADLHAGVALDLGHEPLGEAGVAEGGRDRELENLRLRRRGEAKQKQRGGDPAHARP